MGLYINELRREKEKIESSLMKIRQIMEEIPCVTEGNMDNYKMLEKKENEYLQQLADIECKIKNEE